MRYNETYQSIRRYNLDTGATATMKCYDSLTDTSAANYSTKLGHANELQVVGIDGTNYLYAATCTSDKSIAACLARMKISGTSAYFTGYIELYKTNGDAISSISGIARIKQEGGYIYGFAVRTYV